MRRRTKGESRFRRTYIRNMDLLIPISILTGCAASVEDLWRARISNWTSGGAVAGGIFCHVMRNGWVGISNALLGGLIGFSVFLVFYLAGGMGGGDVKLMAGFGTLLGTPAILQAAILAAVLGALLAAGVWCIRSRFGRRVCASDGIPYAPAIALGACLVLIGGDVPR